MFYKYRNKNGYELFFQINSFHYYCWFGAGSFSKIGRFKNRIGFSILDLVVTIRNNSGLINYAEMPILHMRGAR